MTESIFESMADVRRRLADVIDRAYRDHIPTIVTRRGRPEAVVVDYARYMELIELEEAAEDAWLGGLVSAAEAEGLEPTISFEQMVREIHERASDGT